MDGKVEIELGLEFINRLKDKERESKDELKSEGIEKKEKDVETE